MSLKMQNIFSYQIGTSNKKSILSVTVSLDV